MSMILSIEFLFHRNTQEHVLDVYTPNMAIQQPSKCSLIPDATWLTSNYEPTNGPDRDVTKWKTGVEAAKLSPKRLPEIRDRALKASAEPMFQGKKVWRNRMLGWRTFVYKLLGYKIGLYAGLIKVVAHWVTGDLYI